MTLRSSLLALLPLALLSASAMAAHAADQPRQPLTLVSQTYLPDIVGDFDHFAVDLKRNHLFVSAEVHHSIEMFDLKTGEHLKSLPGFKTPHSVAFSPDKDELMICDGGDSSLILLNAQSLERTDRIQLVDGSATTKADSPDAAFYDAGTRLYYIGNGGVSAKLATSKISVFSVDQRKLIGDFEVPGDNVESIGVDDVHNRLYVNIRDKKQIGVFDLKTKQMLTTWTTPDMNRNTALLVDPKSERIFVAGRKPGTLYVFNPDGKVVAQKPCVETNDDMNWDPQSKLLYVSGTQGLSIYHQDTPDTYTEVTRIPTNGGKTSTLVSQAGMFFVVHPKTDVDMAGLLVYHVNSHN